MSDQDPVAWLRAQIGARHELALLATANRDPRGSGKRLGGEWETGCTCKGECPGYPRCEEVTGDGIHIYAEGGHDADQALLIAANDPQDTIARCEAELAILDLYGKQAAKEFDNAMEEDRTWVLASAVRLLASGYRHRPGFSALWPDP